MSREIERNFEEKEEEEEENRIRGEGRRGALLNGPHFEPTASD